MKIPYSLSLMLVACILSSCGQEKKESTTQNQSSDRASGRSVITPRESKTLTESGQTEIASLAGATVAIAGVSFTPPTEWKNLGPSQMRVGTYTYGPTGSDTDSATVAVFYFGADQGGGIEDNLDRWLGQMSVPSGDSRSAATLRSDTASGLPVHWVELAGTYSASMGGMMSGNMVEKEGYFLSGAIVEAPDGLLFFKLTGPLATAQEMTTQMKVMIAAIKPLG